VILNTCTIRENADLKLYSALGQLKAQKERRPQMQIAVGGLHGPEGPRGDPRARGVGRRRLRHPQSRLGAVAAASRPDEGPLVEVLDAPDPETNRDMAPALYAVRELSFAAWMTIQTGCDNSCAFCIVPSVRGGEISRPFDDLIEEATMLADTGVSEITVLGQNVNSYGRDITKRGPLFAQLLRALGEVEGLERIRFTSPHPKDLRPETIAAMAETPAVCPQLHLPLQSGSNRVLRDAARLQRRALPEATARRARGASTTWRSPPTSSSGSPARATPSSTRPSTSCADASSTRPTPSSSRRAPAPARPR
jgi:tRNA-2-methylthio-N6-dimethylallyladenosine synthase